MRIFNPLHPFAPLALLLIPMVAALFTDSVQWTIRDFLVMGMLLVISGFAIRTAQTRLKSTKSRAISIGIIVLLFLLIWTELAVGILP